MVDSVESFRSVPVSPDLLGSQFQMEVTLACYHRDRTPQVE